MEDKLRAAFDSVHAEAELKERTLAFLADAGGASPARHRPAARLRRAIAAAAACLLVLLGAGGYYALLVPPPASMTATIIRPAEAMMVAQGIPVNPEELSLNRLDRVISVEAFNPEGEALASTLDVAFLPYTQALEEILSSKAMSAYLAEDSAVSITVACDNPDKSAQLLSAAQACAQGCGGRPPRGYVGGEVPGFSGAPGAGPLGDGGGGSGHVHAGDPLPDCRPLRRRDRDLVRSAKPVILQQFGPTAGRFRPQWRPW